MTIHRWTTWIICAMPIIALPGAVVTDPADLPASNGGTRGSISSVTKTRDQSSPARAYLIDGLQVIHRHIPESDLVSVNLYLLGGARQISETTAGIEPLLLRASEHGTRRYPGLAARRELARTGSWIFVQAADDWTVFGMRGRAEEFNSTWAVFADRIIRPTLDTTAVETERAKMLASAKSRQSDPDAILQTLVKTTALQGHPYGLDVQGTESSLSLLEISDLEDYLTEQMVTSRMLLVVVGNVSAERLEIAVSETLGQLPVGEYAWELPPAWARDDPSVTVAFRAIPTRYILGYFGGPLASSEDLPAFRLAVAALSSMISSRARNEGLSYTGRAFLFDRGVAGGGIYFTTDFPEECIKLTNDAIDLLQRATYRRSVLRDYARGSISDYYVQNETTGEQASFLARAFLYRGMLPGPKEHVDELLGIAPTDVKNAAKDYFQNIQYALVGDTIYTPRSEMMEH